MFYDCECGAKYSTKKAKMCKKCAGKKNSPSKIDWPSKEELIKMINDSSISKVASQLGISASAVKKRIK